MKKGKKKVSRLMLVVVFAIIAFLVLSTLNNSSKEEQVMAEMPVQNEDVIEEPNEEITEEVVEEKVVDTKVSNTKSNESSESSEIGFSTKSSDVKADNHFKNEESANITSDPKIGNDEEEKRVANIVEEVKKQGDKTEEFSTEEGNIAVTTKETPVDTDAEKTPKGEKKAIDFSSAVEIDSEESK